MNTLFILNDAPYGSERSYNALRLARQLGKMDGETVFGRSPNTVLPGYLRRGLIPWFMWTWGQARPTTLGCWPSGRWLES